MSSAGWSGLPSNGGTRVSGNADAVISATRSDSTRPSPVSTVRSVTRAAPSATTVFSDRRQIAKSWSTLGSTPDAAVSCVSRRTTRAPSSNGSRLYSSSSATSMPIAPIAMAPASERPPTIVSAGYFSSRRAPSFQSSHEIAARPVFICSAPQVRAFPAILYIAKLSASIGAPAGMPKVTADELTRRSWKREAKPFSEQVKQGFRRASTLTRLLVHAHVLGAGSFRSLTALESHSLAFTQFVEPRATAGRLVKEVLAAVTRRDEAESLVRQPLDRTVHRRHCRLAVERQLKVASTICSPGMVRCGIGFPRNSRRHA